MPVWPFGRRGGHAAKSRDGSHPGVPYSLESAGDDGLRRKGSRRSKRPRKRVPNSNASMRDGDRSSPDSSPVDAPFEKKYPFPRNSKEDITALPYSKQLEASPHLRPVTGNHGVSYNFQTNSHSSLPTAKERGKLQRPQSLRKSRTDHDPTLTRRKSSKRRKNDHVREEEIRAMSMPLPQKRPAGSSGGMLRRESKKFKGVGLNRHFERPTSEISLPMPESIHSSMSSGSESRAFRVSALDMLSPRPKIRFSVGSQYYYDGTSRSPFQPARGDSKRENKLSFEKEDIDDRKRSKRIDDLADTLDAGALREILERDKRRRERKRKADNEKLHRKLERRAEKQRESEQSTTPAIESTPVVGLGIEKDTPTPMEDIRHSTPPPPPPLPEQIQPTTPIVQQTVESQPLPTPVESPIETPVVADAQAVRYSRASFSSASPGHSRALSNISHMPELPSELAARRAPDETVETTEGPRTSGPLHPIESVTTAETISQKGTGRRRSSEGRRMRMWAAIFRRGKRKSSEQMRTPPSEASFSNTSRESMARQPLPAHLVATPVVPIRRPSGVPARTMSKFREDLPEYPLSPPDSRVQSPEVGAINPIASRRGSRPLSNIRVESNSPTGDTSPADNETRPSLRTDSPVSPTVAATGLMSQSLASIDSEGSWLSGKPVKRRSNKSHVRSSVGSGNTATKHVDDFSGSYEELGIPDDEYFRRLTPQAEDQRRSGHSGDVFTRKASSTAIAAMSTTAESDDDERPPTPGDRATVEEDDSIVGGEKLVQDSVERHPTVVHRQPRVKSTEALLSYFTADEPAVDNVIDPSPTEEAMDPEDSPTSETGPITLQRARSVDLGKKHVRHLSAGSARLLDIPAKRASIDQKRLSNSSQNQLTKSQ